MLTIRKSVAATVQCMPCAQIWTRDKGLTREESHCRRPLAVRASEFKQSDVRLRHWSDRCWNSQLSVVLITYSDHDQASGIADLHTSHFDTILSRVSGLHTI